MAEPESEITEDEATDALHQVMGIDSEIEGEPIDFAPEPVAAEPPVNQSGPADGGSDSVEVAPAEGDVSAETEEVAPADDVESLLARNKKLEESAIELEARHAARLDALKQRNSQSEQILRDRYIRKSTLSDKMAQALRKSRSAEGVPEAEVDQVIRDFEGSLNPASASYVAPQQQVADNDDQILILNQFLSEKDMDMAEADKFGTWIKTEASTVMPEAEQRVAQNSLDGFLRLAHVRWQDGIKNKQKDDDAKRADTLSAVRSVKRTQREAARAASPTIAAPKKQPGSQVQEVDLDKFTEGDISSLLHQAVDEYK